MKGSERNEEATRARRRCRGRDGDTEETRTELRRARAELRGAIRKTKDKAWGELLSTLEADPWGRPYRMATRKLRGSSSPVAESISGAELRAITDELFPRAAENSAEPAEPNRTSDNEENGRGREEDWSCKNDITEDEMRRAVGRMTTRRTAPGPDGIHGRALGLAVTTMGRTATETFSVCLREGYFPARWKRARLVLIPKPGGKGKPTRYRPICLLSEAGTLLERLIARRITGHLETMGPDLHEDQYGFRALDHRRSAEGKRGSIGNESEGWQRHGSESGRVERV